MAEINVDDALEDDNPLKVDSGDEDAAMSQLAALLTEEDGLSKKTKNSRPKSDAIQAILASAGVEYTHENSEVVGSSKVEARLSRRAEETGGDITVGGEVLFADTTEAAIDDSDLKLIQYKYNPPEDVIKRQFCTMAKMFGYDNATLFAFEVEGWTQEQRRNFLDTFYRKRKDRLADLAGLEAEKVGIGVSSTSVFGNGEDDETDDDDDDDEL